MLTNIGRFLRKLRIDRSELLKDMAQKLNVSVSFLSAVENGKKRMPSEWNARLCDLYNLDEYQQAQFSEAIAQSEKAIEMDLESTSEAGRRLAVSFARQLPYFSDDQIEAMQRIMRHREDD